MHGQPNPTLAYEQVVLERFSPSGPTVDPDRDALFKSILDRHRKQLSGTLYDTPVQAERVQVKIAPSPEYAGIINFVQDYPDPQQMASARELIDKSRATLGDYLGRYQEMSGLPPKVIVAPQTDLPAFANGTVPAYSLSTTGVEAAAREFLQTNQVFLGLTPAAGTALTDSLRSPQALDQSVGVISAQAAKHAGLCHVRFQQWQGTDDAALPVYGGRVTMHMATTVTAAGSRRPATVTNSYFPLPDREFVLTVSPERAKEVARQTVLAYLTRRELAERLDRYLEDINGNELNKCINAFADARSAALAVQEAVVQAAAQTAPDISAATLRPFWRMSWNTAFRFRSYAPPWPAAPAAGRNFAALRRRMCTLAEEHGGQ